MRKRLTVRVVSAALVAILMALPAGILGQGLTVSGYADFEAVVKAEAIRVASFITLAPAMADPVDVYKSQCKVCHGDSGKGNGVAAIAFNPKPANFTAAAFATSRTLEQVVAAILDGKDAMPGFADIIPPEDIEALASYVLELSVRAQLLAEET